MTDPHARQKRYRQRIKAKADKAQAMEVGLRQILNRLEGNTKPLAIELRNIVLQSLGEGER